jgi:hypothetical protein
MAMMCTVLSDAGILTDKQTYMEIPDPCFLNSLENAKVKLLHSLHSFKSVNRNENGPTCPVPARRNFPELANASAFTKPACTGGAHISCQEMDKRRTSGARS